MNIELEMLNNRIIILNEEITNKTANDLILKLLYLDSINTSDIYLYINSPGGDVFQGLAIIDCMNYIKSKVNTIVIGTSYSMAAIILSCGHKRYALPNSEIMIHQPLGHASGKATDIMLTSERIKEIRERLAKIISKNAKKSVKKVLEDMNKDYFLNPQEAITYGLIDSIIKKGGI